MTKMKMKMKIILTKKKKKICTAEKENCLKKKIK